MRTIGIARRVTLVTLMLVGLGCSSALAMEKPSKDQHQGATMKSEKQININTASVGSLAKNLIRIGRVKAKRIVKHREANGPFGSADELLEIKGISHAVLKANEDRIILE